MFGFTIDIRKDVRYNDNIKNKCSEQGFGFTRREEMTERELRCYRNKMRRVRELRRKAVMAIVTLLVVLGFALSYNALVTQATSEIEDISYKYFTSIEISSGDTLWSIAEEYADAQYYASVNDYIEEVKHTNHLTSDALVAGQFLIVPYYSQEFIK